jgi:hypothetical protein
LTLDHGAKLEEEMLLMLIHDDIEAKKGAKDKDEDYISLYNKS